MGKFWPRAYRGWLALVGALLPALSPVSAAYADSGAGSIAFSRSTYFVALEAGVAFITLDRVGGSSGAAFATYVTSDASARAGSDYAATQGTVRWSDGDATPKAFKVPISPAGAGAGAGARAFTVSLISASGAAFGAPISSTVYISPPAIPVASGATGSIQFSEPVYSVAPDATSVLATLNRVQGSHGSAQATYIISSDSALAGVAFGTRGGTLSWADGDSSPKSFSVPLVPNAAVGQSFSLVLSSASGAYFGSPIDATVAIRQTAAGAVTLSWSAPTQNTDGSALVDLAGYCVYFGVSGGPGTQVIRLANPSATSIAMYGLTQGTWYFSAAAYNSSGALSDVSGVVSVTLQ